MTDKEAMKLALDVLRDAVFDAHLQDQTFEAIKSLEEALAKQEQGEPVAIYQYQMGDGSWIDQEKHNYDYNKLHAPNATVRVVYTTPQQRTWVGLTDDERNHIWNKSNGDVLIAIEAKLKEKNGL